VAKKNSKYTNEYKLHANKIRNGYQPLSMISCMASLILYLVKVYGEN